MSLVEKQLGRGWQVMAAKCDPRCFGMGCARARIYMWAWRKDKVTWRPECDLMSLLSILTSKSVLGAKDYFWDTTAGPSNLSLAEEPWLQ